MTKFITKSFVLAILFGGILITGCKKINNETEPVLEESNFIQDKKFREPILEEEEGELPILNIKNGIAIFKDYNSFFKASTQAQSTPTKDRIVWEGEQNFTSMQSHYELAWDEFETLETYEEYLLWRERNADIWNLSSEDDGFFSMPISRECDSYMLNLDGQVIIDDTLRNLKDPYDSFYDHFTKPILKVYSYNTSCNKNLDKKRIEVRLYDQETTYLLSIKGYKKFLWMWKRYETNHAFEVFSDVTGYGTKAITCEKNGGPWYRNDSHIINNKFNMTCQGLTYRFRISNDKTYSILLKFSAWTGGVPLPCEVWMPIFPNN